MAGYEFGTIEKKWQDYWADNQTFRQPNPSEQGFAEKPKMYILDMFPYPSGAGLHVGHPEGYTATDIITRFKRMKGFNVLHPMGYDAFGLPAEQYAVEHGVHPRETTAKNIDNIERQIKMFGFSYDWSRRVSTTDVKYYRWTQWIFLQLFNSWYDEEVNAARPIGELVDKLVTGRYIINPVGQPVSESKPHISAFFGEPAGAIKWHELSPQEQSEIIDGQRLAYMAEVPVNWCPKLGTVLANEEVTNEGRSERGDHPVYRKAMRQWVLRITAYADRLLKDVETLNWPEPIKIMQRNWIGKSTGAEVDFPVSCSTGESSITVYTTRPDTLFGATYMVLAPEHPLVGDITTADQKAAVHAYVDQAAHKSELDRTADTKDKSGVFTGAYATNPVNDEQIPVWVADYVMMGYGTGAIMAVPAHDTRDFEFAEQHEITIKLVVSNENVRGWGFEDIYMEYFGNKRWSTISYISMRELPVSPEGILEVAKDEGIADHDIKVLPFKDGEAVVLYSRSIDREAVRRFQFILEGTFEYQTGLDCAYIGDGVAINSGKYDGLSTAKFQEKITRDLEKAGTGQEAVNYKLRDWLFSRQRYWGEPFPIIHCDKCGTVDIPEDQLPLELPEMEDFRPASSDDPDAPPAPPLGKIDEWVNTTCPTCNGPARRELNTMPQWAGSCWYYLRYLNSDNSDMFVDPEIEKYWMAGSDTNPTGGVDLYVGGAEHAVLHLLYARFWHKVLYDLGHVSTAEPFGKLFNQGMIRSFAYRDKRGVCVEYHDVDISGDKPKHKQTGEELIESVEKMSKSLKNVVNPDEVIEQYGADTFRLYEMFMGPLEASKPWNTRDVPGVHRFLYRAWRMIEGNGEQPPLLNDKNDESVKSVEKALHKLIKKVGEDIEAMKFNTAIAVMMEFVNVVYKVEAISASQAERFVLVLAPLAPHIAEELWEKLGHDESLAYEPWPDYNPAMVTDEMIEIPVQVSGKVRARISISADASQEECVAAAKANSRIAELIAGKTIVKEIVVPSRLVNLVVK